MHIIKFAKKTPWNYFLKYTILMTFPAYPAKSRSIQIS
jgi:hypothetical protein